MTTKGNFSNETTIYVSTKAKLNVEQTQSITDELLGIMGYTDSYRGVRIRFIDEDGLTQANASVDHNLKVSINN